MLKEFQKKYLSSHFKSKSYINKDIIPWGLNPVNTFDHLDDLTDA